jgi:hypothetical protein
LLLSIAASTHNVSVSLFGTAVMLLARGLLSLD